MYKSVSIKNVNHYYLFIAGFSTVSSLSTLQLRPLQAFALWGGITAKEGVLEERKESQFLRLSLPPEWP